MLEFLVGFCLCEVAALGLVALVLKLPPGRLLVPFLVLLLPAVAAGPLFYWTYNHSGRPRLRSYLFALAVFAFTFFFQLALLYSALMLGFLTQMSAASWIPYAIVGALLGSASAYYHAFRRLSTKKPSGVAGGAPLNR